MRQIVSASLVCCLAAAFVALSRADTFDGVDVDATLKNPEVVKTYVDCILGKGTCNDSAKRLKEIVPNALLEKCSKCTEAQKRIVGFIAYTMSTKSPQQWESVLDKYDPKKEKRADIAQLISAAAPSNAAAAAAAAAAAGTGSTAAAAAAGSTAKPSGATTATTATTAKPITG